MFDPGPFQEWARKEGIVNETNGSVPRQEEADPFGPRTEPEVDDDSLFEELLAKYEKASRTAAQLKFVKIVPRKPLLGKWMREGDLGFVYGERGSGKTWLVDAIAIHLSTGEDLDDWRIQEAVAVYIIDGEMPLDASCERVRGLGADNDLLHVLHHEVLFDQSGQVMNLANPRQQRVITELCVRKNVKLLVLDNLSCLFSGVKENDADEWEKVLSWLLEMRRRRIAILIVHHSGISGDHMRGTSKREDAAFWVVKVDAAKNREPDETGARFETSFEKQRNSDRIEWRRQWVFKTEPDGRVSIGCTEISLESKVLQLIQDGLGSATDIASELRVAKSTISKAAKKLEDQGLIEVKNRQYVCR